MSLSRRLLSSLALLALCSAPAALAGEAHHESHDHAAAAREDAGLERVEAGKVCMVNDTFFARPQIPVEVEGKTYYGCCEMCKTRLAQDEEIRAAVDPLTGKPVDKATAVIAARPDGTVLYFASEENLAKYREKSEG